MANEVLSAAEILEGVPKFIDAVFYLFKRAGELAFVDSNDCVASGAGELVVRLKPADCLLGLALAARALDGYLGVIEHRGTIQEEAGKIRNALISEPDGSRYSQLYAAQQALAWALEPSGFAAPFTMLMGTPGGQGDCQAEPHQPQS